MMGFGYLMMLVWLLAAAAVVAVVVWLIVRLADGGGRTGSGTPAESARQVLDRRLARGEIDIEEHRRLRAELD